MINVTQTNFDMVQRQINFDTTKKVAILTNKEGKMVELYSYYLKNVKAPALIKESIIEKIKYLMNQKAKLKDIFVVIA